MSLNALQTEPAKLHMPHATRRVQSEQPSTFHKDTAQAHHELVWVSQPSGPPSWGLLQEAGHDWPSQALLGGQRSSAQDLG